MPLLEYDIEFENRKLISIEDFHKNIGILEEWLICDKDAKKVSNGEVCEILKSIRILDLEKNWNLKAENNWNTTIQKIVSSIKAKKPLTSVEYDFLYLFYKGQIFPLTPHLIVIGYKGYKMDNQYQVQELSDDEVDKVNDLIINNAIEKYITD